jgi:CRP-like cAMP-binding protein
MMMQKAPCKDPEVREDQAAELFSRLKRDRLFGPCADDVLRMLVARATLHSAQRGTSIAQAGTPFPYLGFLLHGVLSVTVTGDGPMRGVHRLQLYEAHRGDIFGEVAFFESAPPPGDIVAVSKAVEYALFAGAAVDEAIAVDRQLLRRLTAHVANLARVIAQRVVAQQGFSAMSRVASVLLRFASDEGGLQPAQSELAEITQRDIAAAAACVKESAARAITALETAGALRRERGHIRYLDKSVLLYYASGASGREDAFKK